MTDACQERRKCSPCLTGYSTPINQSCLERSALIFFNFVLNRGKRPSGSPVGVSGTGRYCCAPLPWRTYESRPPNYFPRSATPSHVITTPFRSKTPLFAFQQLDTRKQRTRNHRALRLLINTASN